MRATRILETAIYADDLAAAAEFYTTVLGLKLVSKMGERGLTFRCGDAVLLVFDPAHSSASGSNAPAHGTEGPGHVAFVLEEGSIDAWRVHLTKCGVAIEKEVDWPNGGRSVYFRDPAGNSVELAPANLWWD